jgi:hypothetical protein
MCVFYWVARFAQNRGGGDIAVGCSLFALFAAAMAFPLRWKLRTDDDGVSWRRLLRWDTWSWADLGSGRIRKLYPHTLHDPERRWWRRTLRLGYMTENDIQEVISRINTHYRLPAPPDVPDTLVIEYGFRFRCSATFDQKGVHLIVRDTPHEYMWREIRSIHFVRMDPLRRDFKSLLISLPDQEIELTRVTQQGRASPTWCGATVDEINEYFLQTVPADRIHVSIAGQPPTSREYIERELERTKKSTREFAIIMAVCLSMLILVLVWMAIDDGVLKALVMGVFYAIYPGSVLVFVYREQRDKVRKLSESLNAVVSTTKRTIGSAVKQGPDRERLPTE